MDSGRPGPRDADASPAPDKVHFIIYIFWTILMVFFTVYLPTTHYDEKTGRIHWQGSQGRGSRRICTGYVFYLLFLDYANLFIVYLLTTHYDEKTGRNQGG